METLKMYFIRTALAASTLGLWLGEAQGSSQQSSCFEYGVDYTGYDILTLSGVSSPLLCLDSCAQSPECGYWSFESETSICYLKSHAALLGRTSKANVISGPRSCLTNNGCFSDGVDYVGYDVKRIEGADIPSAEACQEQCVQDPQCAFFSYKKSTRGCYLKSAAAPLGRAVDEDVLSGPRVCSSNNQGGDIGGSPPAGSPPAGSPPQEEQPTPPEDDSDGSVDDMPEKTCVQGSVEYRGHDLLVTKNVLSAAYCQYLCASNSACFFWTWDKNRQTCSQKDQSAADTKYSSKQTLGKVSGARDCIPVYPGCQMLDTTFLGSVVSRLSKTATFETCQLNCQNEASCEYWTFDTSDKMCVLRQATPFEYLTDHSTKGIIAGPKYCPNDDVCIEQADYVGYDLEAIEDGSVSSAVQCRTICRKTEGCAFFTWVQKTKNCYLKTEDALLGKNNELSSLGKYSGPRECYMHYGCMEPNAAYLSASANTLRNVSSFKDCEQKCQQDDTCGRWTYLGAGKICLLIPSEDSTPKIRYDGAISGSQCKSSQTASDHRCLEMGIKFNAVESSIVSAVSVDDCHYECVNTASCKAFTFEEGVGCYLYNKAPASMPKLPSTYQTVVSGPAVCGDSEFAGEADTCYEGGLIEGASFYAFNDAECSSKCNLVTACKFWTFSPKERYESCKLHTGDAQKARCPGSRSSTRSTPAALYDFFYFDGPHTTLTNVESYEACREQCVANNMDYWSYFKKTQECHLHERGNHNKLAEPLAICGTAEDPMAES